MKNILIIMVLLMVASAAFAQSQTRGHGNHGEAQIEKMKAALSLDDKQYATIKSINKKYADKYGELKGDSTVRRKNHDEIKNLRQQQDNEIQAVLTTEQKAKWAAYKTERNEKRSAKVKDGIERRETQMKSELSLSDDQFVKMQAINKSFKEKLMTLKSDSGTTRDKTEFKKARTERDAAIKAILTDEQFKKWSDMKHDRNNGRHHK